jgi:hypothetical protein
MRAIKSILNCAGAIKRDTKIEIKPPAEGEKKSKAEEEGEELV